VEIGKKTLKKSAVKPVAGQGESYPTG